MADFATPEQAQAAFYDAFEHADIDAMMGVWLDDDRVICIHPGGERLCGRDAVRRGWEQIFASGARLKFLLSDERSRRNGTLALHALHENISLAGERARQGVMFATNVYECIDGSWRMLMHHASPAPARSPEQVTH